MIKNKIVKLISLVLIILIVIGIFIFKKNVVNEDSTTKNNQVQIYKDSSKKIAKVVNFTQDGCIPCKQMKNLIRELSQEYIGSIDIFESDIYENSTLASKYNVMYTPTQIFLDSDGNVLKSHTGFLGKTKIKNIIEEYESEK